MPDKWLQEKIFHLENYSGGIEELSIKIAKIRTWTYITNHSNWIDDYRFWKNKTQTIEDNLSDHLHTTLTNRFVDFSATFFMDYKISDQKPIIEIDNKKIIKFNGQKYGYIDGFDLKLDLAKSDSLFFNDYVKKSVRKMIEEKINNFLKAPLDSINLGQIDKIKINEEVKIFWGDEAIAKLIKGNNIFSPKVEILKTNFIESDKKIQITQKLQEWLSKIIADTIKPINSTISEEISSQSRAIVFNIFNQLGTMPIKQYNEDIKNLIDTDKTYISKTGIRIGAKFFFMPNLLKKSPMELNALLWKIYHNYEINENYPLPKDGRVSFINEFEMPNSYWFAIGYICVENFVLRVDVFEKIFYLARQKIKEFRLSVVEQTIDAATNKTSPDKSTGRLPILSDKNPTRGIELAKPNK